jgi:glutaminyl-tRNA synthetase
MHLAGPPALHPEMGVRTFPITRELWIEEDDFMEVPSKGYFRYYPPIDDKPGSRVRLRHGYVTECTGFDKDAETARSRRCTSTTSRTASRAREGSDNYKVKGNIHWVSAATALAAEVRLYDRLFTDAQPDAGGKDFISLLNPNAKEVVTAYLEPGMSAAQPDQRFQFERHGYFVADRVDSTPGKPVFNRIVTLKDSFVAK